MNTEIKVQSIYKAFYNKYCFNQTYRHDSKQKKVEIGVRCYLISKYYLECFDIYE